MSEDCPKCNGRLTFYDGAFEHNPKWVCADCGAEYEEEDFLCGCKVAFSKDRSEGIAIVLCEQDREED